nr:hypothetical protein BaRGS_026580 [Batillaria attramentaria]
MAGMMILFVFGLLLGTAPLSTVAVSSSFITSTSNQNAISTVSASSFLFNSGQAVTCSIRVENWTHWPLVNPSVRVAAGEVAIAPDIVVAGGRETMLVHSSPHFILSGTWGTAAWEIMNQTNNRLIYVMWHVPNGHVVQKNTLGVGMAAVGNVTNPPGDAVYKQMFMETPSVLLGFTRDTFDKSVDRIKYEADGVIVEGIMGTGKHVEVKIVIRPTAKNDLAPAILSEIQASSYEHPIDQLYA